MKSNFKAGGVLMSSGMLANALQLAALPFLARLYSPQDYSIYLAATALSAILSAICTLQIDQLLHSHKIDKVKRLTGAAFATSVIVPISLLILWAIASTLPNSFTTEYRDYAFIFTVHLALSSLNLVIAQSITRSGRFNLLAFVTVGSLVVSILSQTAIAQLSDFANGLILGDIAGKTFGLLAFAASSIPKPTPTEIRQVGEVLMENRREISKLTPAVLLNSVSANLSVILFPLAHGVYLGGHYSLANRVVSSPAGVLTATANRLIIHQASSDRIDSGTMNVNLKEPLTQLLWAASIYWCFWFTFGPSVFSLLMGDKWEAAGQFSTILAFGIAFSIVPSSLSGILIVAQDFRGVLAISIVEIVIRLLTFAPAFLANDQVSAIATCVFIAAGSVILGVIGLYRIFSSANIVQFELWRWSRHFVALILGYLAIATLLKVSEVGQDNMAVSAGMFVAFFAACTATARSR